MVVDASILVALLLRRTELDPIERRLSSSSGKLHAPYLLDIEVTNAIRRHVRLGTLSDDAGRRALGVLAAFPAERHAHGFLLPRISSLRHNISAYDAAYVALAEWFDTPLLTRDVRLANAGGHAARIERV